MKKPIFILYGCLLMSIYLVRQLDFSTNKTFQNYFNSYLKQEFSQTNSTSNYRLLGTTSSEEQNATVVKICKEASGDGIVSQSAIDKFNNAKDEYRGAFGPSIGEDLFNKKVPQSSALVQKGIILGLLILFFLFTPILTLCYCCYCCCDKKCPCCCKTDIQKNPFTKRQIFCTLLFVLIFSTLTFSTSIAGYVYSTQINSSYKTLKCTIVTSVDNLNNQQNFIDKDGNAAVFLGLNNLKSELNIISNKFDSYFTQVQGFATYSADQSKKIQKKSLTIENMFSTLKNSIPSTFTAKYQKNIQTGFNDLMSDNEEDPIFYGSRYQSFVDGMISAQQSATKGAVDAMKQAAEQANSFASTDKTTISGPIDEAKVQVEDGRKMLSDTIKNVDSNTEITDMVFNLITIFLMVFYGIFMFIAVVGSIISFLGYLKGMFKVRYCLNVFWCILGLLTFIGFLICIILGVLSIVFMESCETSSKMLNDKEYLKSFDILGSDQIDYITTCKNNLGGDGNILKKFNIDDKVKNIKDTQQSLQDAQNSFDLTQFNKFENYMTQFKKQHETMQNYGMYFDRQDQNWQATPPENVGKYTMLLDYKTAVANFKKETDMLSYRTTGNDNLYKACITDKQNDEFVFEDNQCAAYSYDTAHTTTANSYKNNLSQKECVSYQQISTPTISNLKADTNTRYNTCSIDLIYNNFYQRLTAYVGSGKTRYNQAENLQYQDETGIAPATKMFSGLRSSFVGEIKKEQSTKITNDGFVDYLTQFQDKVKKDVLDGSTEITASLLGSNGLLTKVNCLFFGSTIDNFQQQMCSDSGLAIYNTFKIMCILCFSNFVLIIYFYKMSMKFLGKKKQIDMEGQQNIQPNIEIPEMQKMAMN